MRECEHVRCCCCAPLCRMDAAALRCCRAGLQISGRRDAAAGKLLHRRTLSSPLHRRTHVGFTCVDTMQPVSRLGGQKSTHGWKVTEGRLILTRDSNLNLKLWCVSWADFMLSCHIKEGNISNIRKIGKTFCHPFTRQPSFLFLFFPAFVFSFFLPFHPFFLSFCSYFIPFTFSSSLFHPSCPVSKEL